MASEKLAPPTSGGGGGGGEVPDLASPLSEASFNTAQATPKDEQAAEDASALYGGHNKESVELPEFARRLERSPSSGSSSSSSSSASSAAHVDTIRPAPSANSLRPSSLASATRQALSKKASTRSLPSLRRRDYRLAQKQSHPWQHLGITLGLPMVLLFDLVVPCIVYYTWYRRSVSDWRATCAVPRAPASCPASPPDIDKTILGAAIACFGFGEIWILAARVWRLFFRREECAPLLSRGRWDLDATSWVYLVAVLLALIPFVVGSERELPHLYLYGPSFIMVFLGTLMVISFVPFKLPIGINSQPRGSRMRPFVYYAAEDFIAVDGLQDREFRVRYNERYEKNKRFRRFFVFLTAWWVFGVFCYEGAVSAIIWTLPFHIAFGASFGVLFSWIVTWAACTYAFVEWELGRENRAYEAGEFEA